MTTDDGVRLFVDGEKVLDKWILQGPTTYTVTRQLTEGAHQVVLEYFEAGGGAVARFSYEPTAEPPPPPPPPPEPFAAEYFANRTLSGAPVLTRSDNAIDFDWGEGSPDAPVPADRFSARWTRTKNYAAGTYRFSVTGDDGIRVLVDGAQVVDGWFYQAPTTYTADVPLSDGRAHRRRRVLRAHRRRGRQVQRDEAHAVAASSSSVGSGRATSCPGSRVS